MHKPRIGIIGLVSPVESGGQRAQSIMSEAEKALTAAELEIVAAKKIVMTPADAIEVCEQFGKAGLDLIALINITWVIDSLEYIFVNKLNLPIVLWAIPYTETFSIGCVQHFGSILTNQGIPYEYIYGLPDDNEVVNKLKVTAVATAAIKKLRNANIALVGPRQTWRVAGPQDMSNEEWEFSYKFGTTIVHVEMSTILAAADKVDDGSAKFTLKDLMKRSGKTLASDEAMIYAAKVYTAVKEIKRSYNLDLMAAECYPEFGGLMNLPASWLADEGFILDTEGDIGHCSVMFLMSLCQDGPVALGEIGSFNGKEDFLAIAHEGSTAMSYAESLADTQINPSGLMGTFVGVPLKRMQKVTISSMTGSSDCYKLLVANAESLKVSHQEWIDGGSKLIAKLRVAVPAPSAVDTLIANGMDHHILMKGGNLTEHLSVICRFLGLEEIRF